MQRKHLNELLRRYAACWPEEEAVAARFAAFVRTHEDCLLRSCAPGHITSSAWIVSPDGEHALLTHHRKLGRWLQLGGHVDGDPEIEAACLREAQEESGMQAFLFVPWWRDGGRLVPLDLDVHGIPARANEPAHEHWDVRFLLRALPDQPLVISAESNRLCWVPRQRLREFTDEHSVLRLDEKARALGQ